MLCMGLAADFRFRRGAVAYPFTSSVATPIFCTSLSAQLVKKGADTV